MLFVPARPRPPLASIAIISLMHILPGSTHMLRMARYRSPSTVPKSRGGSLLAGLLQLEIVGAVRASVRLALACGDPLLETGIVEAVEREVHAGEAGAAVVRRKALVVAGVLITACSLVSMPGIA